MRRFRLRCVRPGAFLKLWLAGLSSSVLACGWFVDDRPPLKGPDAAQRSHAGRGGSDAAAPPPSSQNSPIARAEPLRPDASASPVVEPPPRAPASGCFLSARGAIRADQIGRGLPGWVLAGSEAGDRFGSSVAAAGDVNGDGIGDFVVGAPGASRGSGAAFVWLGDASHSYASTRALGVGGTRGFVVPGVESGDHVGASVAAAGDVNGDGLDDWIVGAPGVRVEGLPAVGAAYVVFGRVDSAPISLVEVARGRGGFAIFGSTVGQRLGHSVAGAGDVDGDGFDDVSVGAPGSHTDSLSAAFLVFGARDPESVFTGTLQAGAARGFSLFEASSRGRRDGAVAGVGDADGDGLDDVALTLSGMPSAAVSTPVAHLFSRTDGALLPSELNESMGLRGALLAASGSSGVAVAGAGDVNGNGLDDVVICSSRAGMGHVTVCRERAWALSDAMPSSRERDAGAPRKGSAALAFESADCSVAAGGDVDGDGRGDWVAGGGDVETEGGKAAGRVWVVPGALPGSVSVSGGQAGDRLGHSVALLGDVDADGLDDLLFGAPGRNGATGAAFLLFGCSELLESERAPPQLGGPGDDTFFYDGPPLGRVSGGNGVDTLEFRGRGLTLDLRSSVGVRDTERIDLRGGHNTLLLDDVAVRRLPQHRPGLTPPLAKTLVVLGESGDVLVFDAASYEEVPGGQAGRRVLRRAGAYYGLEVGSRIEIRSP